MNLPRHDYECIRVFSALKVSQLSDFEHSVPREGSVRSLNKLMQQIGPEGRGSEVASLYVHKIASAREHRRS
jgi:hypothetical protein